MVLQPSLLLALVDLIDVIPSPLVEPRRGRPPVYSERLFLKALAITLVRNVSTVSGLVAILEQRRGRCRHSEPASPSTAASRPTAPGSDGWRRCPAASPARIACLGRHLVALLDLWADQGRTVAIDSTVLRARGGVWHKKHRSDVDERVAHARDRCLGPVTARSS